MKMYSGVHPTRIKHQLVLDRHPCVPGISASLAKLQPRACEGGCPYVRDEEAVLYKAPVAYPPQERQFQQTQ